MKYQSDSGVVDALPWPIAFCAFLLIIKPILTQGGGVTLWGFETFPTCTCTMFNNVLLKRHYDEIARLAVKYLKYMICKL